NEALAAFRALTKISSRDVRGFRNLALCLNSVLDGLTGDDYRKSANEALAAFARVCEIDPSDAGLWFDYANLQSKCGDYQHAIASYERALALKPGWLDALSNLGEALRLNGSNFQEAVERQRQALSLRPGDPGIRALLGNALLGAKCFDEAES